MKKNQLRPIGLRFLRAVHILKLSDLSILTPLLVREGHGAFAVREMARRFKKAGLVYTVPKRIPLTHFAVMRAPNVYMLSGLGAQILGLSEQEQRLLENRFHNLKYSRQSYRLMHDLDISVVHAALLKGQHLKLFKLSEWQQGEDTQVEGGQDKRRPDFIYTLNGTYTVVGELDTGEERLRSNDKSRRTIEQKVHSYGRIDNASQDPFRVQFVVSRPLWLEEPKRASSVLEVCKADGHVGNHRKDFYQVVKLEHYRAALETGDFSKPVIHCAGFDRLLTIAPPRATPEAGVRQDLAS